uniref:Rad60-SLD domain-containing protein n=1 Tax=Meloidogyne hapla TaxID=6305 RepID=A0A1I8C1H4_MELHA
MEDFNIENAKHLFVNRKEVNGNDKNTLNNLIQSSSEVNDNNKENDQFNVEIIKQINLQLHDEENIFKFKISEDMELAKLYKTYCNYKKINEKFVYIIYNTKYVSPYKTPKELKIINGAVLTVKIIYY